jgi:hypothetical protein
LVISFREFRVFFCFDVFDFVLVGWIKKSNDVLLNLNSSLFCGLPFAANRFRLNLRVTTFSSNHQKRNSKFTYELTKLVKKQKKNKTFSSSKQVTMGGKL